MLASDAHIPEHVGKNFELWNKKTTIKQLV